MMLPKPAWSFRRLLRQCGLVWKDPHPGFVFDFSGDRGPDDYEEELTAWLDEQSATGAQRGVYR